MFKKRLHVFKAGPQVSAQGIEREFSPKDLQEVVESYDPKTHEAPLVIGHSGDNDSAPSYGWIEKFVRKGDDLYADVNFTDTAKDLVKDGHYRKVSISFYSPTSPINPHKGQWSARHLALLGASPPAVKGLEPFSFSEKQGVFDFATALSPDTIFDKELGPTMIIEKSPLELLKERLEEIRGQINESLQDLKENQQQQAETNVAPEEAMAPEDGSASPQMPTQAYSEGKKKKMGLEGTETSEVSQKLANLETMAPEDKYVEGVKRKVSKGANGQEVQVVEEVFEEGVNRKVSQGAHGQKVQVVEEVFEESPKKTGKKPPMAVEEEVEEEFKEKHGKKAKSMPMVSEEEEMEEEFKEKHGKKAKEMLIDEEEVEEEFKEKSGKKSKAMPIQMDDEDDDMEDDDMEDEFKEKHGKKAKKMSMADEEEEMLEGEFREGVGDKSVKSGKATFGRHSERVEDVAGRGLTGRSRSDSYGDRQAVGKGEADGREMTSDDSGKQDEDREATAKDFSQKESREKLAKADASGDAGDAESRWADQPEAKALATNANQYDEKGGSYSDRQKPGISDGNEPHGRDGGPTKVSSTMEEEPSNEEFAVDVQSSKGNSKVRVIHQKSGDKREAIKGKDIPTDADEAEYVEGVSHKITKDGKVSFGYHDEKRADDPEGRAETGKAGEDDDRDSKGNAPEEDREGVTSNGEQDEDRVHTSSDSEQDEDREKTAKAAKGDAGDAESRWEGQPEAKEHVMNNDQFDDSHDAGISDGNDPHGRDGGPTKVSNTMEEEPSNEEIAVPLTNVKDDSDVRVVYQKAGEKRAPVKGGAIDHVEGEADGLTREPAPAKVSRKKDPMGRSDGPTEFPDKSEEDPDNLEMAVDLPNATQDKKVRIVRQKSGDAPTLDHKEKAKTPMTKTGKGSTYGQKTPVLVDEEEVEMEEYCGMGSMGQKKAMGYPTAMFEELKALKEENDRLKKEYEEQKIRARKGKIAEFVEGLYVSGKLTDGVIPQRELQNYCEGLEFGTLEFSEGESPVSTLFTLLERLPNMVYYGEVVSNAEYQDPADDDLSPHERAMRMVANGEASDYVEAIKMCIPWGTRS